MAMPIVMPKQGNTVEACTIVKWHKNKGDSIAEKEPLFTYETDKATFEFESPCGGTLLEIFSGDDTIVPVLSTVAAVGKAGEDVSSLRPVAAVAPKAETLEAGSSRSAVTSQQESLRPAPAAASEGAGISPRARAFARDKGVDTSALAGTGPGGRTIERDVIAAFQAGAPLTRSAWAAVSAGAGQSPDTGSGIGGRVRAGDLVSGRRPQTVAAATPQGFFEQTKITGIRKIIAQKMMQSLADSAQLTMQVSANATNMLAYRKAKKGAGFAFADIVLTAFALSRTLPKFPEINSLLVGDTLYRYKSVHLAFAVDTPRGLMVPVVRDADKLSLKELTTAIMTASSRCNNGTISPDSLTGGTITLSPLGAFGIESFTPVLNPPQVAILGLSTIVPRPVFGANGEYAIAPFIGLSLTIDHQAVDGAPAARFLQALVQSIENITQTLAV